MAPLFTQHICPRFAPRLLFREEGLVSRFWSEDAPKVVKSEVDAYHQYEEDLERLFCPDEVIKPNQNDVVGPR